jgi:hypothetical protein
MQIVRNNGSAAIAWFNSPQFFDEQGDTTIAVSTALLYTVLMHTNEPDRHLHKILEHSCTRQPSGLKQHHTLR